MADTTNLVEEVYTKSLEAYLLKVNNTLVSHAEAIKNLSTDDTLAKEIKKLSDFVGNYSDSEDDSVVAKGICADIEANKAAAEAAHKTNADAIAELDATVNGVEADEENGVEAKEGLVKKVEDNTTAIAENAEAIAANATDIAALEEAVGTPAVAGEEGEEGTPASGLYKAIDDNKAAAEAAVKAVEDRVGAIEDSVNSGEIDARFDALEATVNGIEAVGEEGDADYKPAEDGLKQKVAANAAAIAANAADIADNATAISDNADAIAAIEGVIGVESVEADEDGNGAVDATGIFARIEKLEADTADDTAAIEALEEKVDDNKAAADASFADLKVRVFTGAEAEGTEGEEGYKPAVVSLESKVTKNADDIADLSTNLNTEKGRIDDIIEEIGEKADGTEGVAVSGIYKYVDDSVDAMKNAILGGGVTEAFDTLQEVETWINEHGDEAADLTTQVAANETKLNNLDNFVRGTAAVGTEGEEGYVAAKPGLKDTVADNKAAIAVLDSSVNALEEALGEATDTSTATSIFGRLKKLEEWLVEIEAVAAAAATDLDQRVSALETNA